MDAGERMSADAPLASWKAIVEKLFPWLAYVTPAKDGGLSLRAAAAKLLHLQGDAGDPAALRVGDVAALVFDPGIPGTTAPALYLTRDGGQTFVLVALVTPGSTVGGTVPPPPTTPSTQLAPTGSATVTIR
jgi:hypothetical protein